MMDGTCMHQSRDVLRFDMAVNGLIKGYKHPQTSDKRSRMSAADCRQCRVCFSLAGSVTDKPPGPANSGRKGELSSAVCVRLLA